MGLQVYKFGGASIATPERMQALLPIIRNAEGQLIIVVSALGKTTNALEAIVKAAIKGEAQKAKELVSQLTKEHSSYAQAVLQPKHYTNAQVQLECFYRDLDEAVSKANRLPKDRFYDSVVSYGELLSSVIFASFLQQETGSIEWFDCRGIIRTDSTYKEGRVDWEVSKQNASGLLRPVLQSWKIVLTQGFIGSDPEGNPVTLGREGTDYTAAMLGAMLGASDVTIWKDVEGLLNADPKQFPNTVHIEAISYHEVVEMTYYGAQVIHPKTIKPLQNHRVPLLVRSFLRPELKGTLISNEVSSLFYPPLVILKQRQLLIQVTSKNFSFITEDSLSYLYSLFHDLRIKISMIQNTAINFIACVQQSNGEIAELKNRLKEDYDVFCNEDVQLLTVRHYTPEILRELTRSKYVIMEQKTRNTVQVVMK